MKKTLLTIVFTILIFNLVFAQSTMELKVYSIVDKYWEKLDARLTIQTEPEKYNQASETLNNELEKFAETLQQDSKAVKEFSEVYKTLPNESKAVFNDLVGELVAVTRSGEELFPGYGYADPDYYYRRGGEVNKELLSKFWKSEERYLEKNKRHKFYIELAVSTQMNQSAEAGGNIEGFDVKGVYGMKINGEFKQVAEVEFTTKESVTTKAVIAYEKNKTFYELLKAKKSFWDFLPWVELSWEHAGTTYVIGEEATDTQVILETPDFIK